LAVKIYFGLHDVQMLSDDSSSIEGSESMLAKFYLIKILVCLHMLSAAYSFPKETHVPKAENMGQA